MHWNFIYDDEIRGINCFDGLYNLFALHFQNNSVFMNNNGDCNNLYALNAICFEVTNAFSNQTWVKTPLV